MLAKCNFATTNLGEGINTVEIYATTKLTFKMK